MEHMQSSVTAGPPFGESLKELEILELFGKAGMLFPDDEGLVQVFGPDGAGAFRVVGHEGVIKIPPALDAFFDAPGEHEAHDAVAVEHLSLSPYVFDDPRRSAGFEGCFVEAFDEREKGLEEFFPGEGVADMV
ncbi:hypothetical protein TRIP_E190058 [uncultured Spirochaetota bacterium]|uniref:Uncharacterized protein n=1 Tax=uncultured Spirochaetota bacterium TaxID=460511 RepID=A0A652ZTN4_9SPIR|nr:hypothetical protein TRIP_E190058 [uncultured Spirochaetota bacterium]